MRCSWFKAVCRALLLAVMVSMVIGTHRSENLELEIPDISQRVNSFTMDLLKHQAEAEGAAPNTVMSPQSIFHGLAMSYIASGGETREELQKVFHFPKKNEELLTGLAGLRKQLHEADRHKRIDITMANSAWLDEAYADFRKEYVKQVRDAFEASLHRVRFEMATRVSYDINNWVSEKTRGKIQKSVDPGDFKSRSRSGIIDEPGLVTVSAVYFKADWGSRFDKASTRTRTFHVDRATTVETPMMHQQSLLPYSENERLKFLEIPYVDRHYSMYLILPKDVIGISELTRDVTIDEVVALRRQAFGHEVDVLLPKCEMTSHHRVKDALAAMGVTSAFSRQAADFDKMIVKNAEAFRIYISEIHHDAWIDIHEEGTEAAAATSTTHFSFGCSAAPRPVLVHQFHADHPFLFMIVHNASRSILFAGWISKPNEVARQSRPAGE